MGPTCFRSFPMRRRRNPQEVRTSASRCSRRFLQKLAWRTESRHGQQCARLWSASTIRRSSQHLPWWMSRRIEPRPAKATTSRPHHAGYGGGYDNGGGGGYGGYDAGGPGWPGDAGTPGWPSWSQEHGVWAPDQGVACGKGAGFGGWPGEGELETEREVECFVLWVGRSAPPRPRGVPPSGHTLRTKPEMGARGGASVAPWRDRPLVPLPSLFTPKPLSPGNPKPWKPGLMFRA